MPGLFRDSEAALQSAPARPARLHLIGYVGREYVEKDLGSVTELSEEVRRTSVFWLNIDGDVDEGLTQGLVETLQIDPLLLEELRRTHPRARYESMGAWLFVRTPTVKLTERLEREDVAFLLSNRLIISIQDGPTGDCLEHVRNRLRKGWRPDNVERAADLFVELLSTVVDSYFPVLEAFGNHLEELEDETLSHPDREILSHLHSLRMDVLDVRHSVWPLRDMLNRMIRDSSEILAREVRSSLRDCYDTCVLLIELVESCKEQGSNLMETYLSFNSNRMNEVMKVLTIITTLFIPPTFIAGIYGMNFNPDKSPWNMPELNWFYGYPAALGVMGVMVIGLMTFLWWRGYIVKPRRRSHRRPSRRRLSMTGDKNKNARLHNLRR